jgi:hypothetical protein
MYLLYGIMEHANAMTHIEQQMQALFLTKMIERHGQGDCTKASKMDMGPSLASAVPT